MNDDLLRDAFAELRQSEAARAPRFLTLWPARPKRRQAAALRKFFLATVLLIIVALSVRRHEQPSITAWKAPTDFLLVTPGRELLQSTPDMGGTRR